MKTATIAAALAAFALGACDDRPETAAEVHEERAEALEEAAEVSTPAGAAQLENLAEAHEEKAEAYEEAPGTVPADPDAVNAPIPDAVDVPPQ